MVGGMSDVEIASKVESVHARLKVVAPSVWHVSEDALCKNWDMGLHELPPFCTDAHIKRFLIASNYDVEGTVMKLQRCAEIELTTRQPQSAAVQEVLKSRRFSYLGHTRSGMPILGIDLMWGKFLDVEGGLDTVLQALAVFLYRKLPCMVERDLGRKATLALPDFKILYVGGSMPISFVRAGFQFWSDHYPGCMDIVRFEPGAYRFRFAAVQQVLRFLPKLPNMHVEYNIAKDRSQVIELLDCADSCIPASLLHQDIGVGKQLAATAQIDREWGLAINHARKTGNDEVILEESEIRTVKNTFVQLSFLEDENERRDRAYSDDEGPFKLEKSVFKDSGDDASTSAITQVPTQSSEESVEEENDENADKPGRKVRRSRRPSGWTRQRHKRAEKMRAEMAAQEDADDADSSPMEGNSFIAEDTDYHDKLLTSMSQAVATFPHMLLFPTPMLLVPTAA